MRSSTHAFHKSGALRKADASTEKSVTATSLSGKALRVFHLAELERECCGGGAVRPARRQHGDYDGAAGEMMRVPGHVVVLGSAHLGELGVTPDVQVTERLDPLLYPGEQPPSARHSALSRPEPRKARGRGEHSTFIISGLSEFLVQRITMPLWVTLFTLISGASTLLF